MNYNKTLQLFSLLLLTMAVVFSLSAATVFANGPVASDTESTPAAETVTNEATSPTGTMEQTSTEMVTDEANSTTDGSGSSLIWWVLGGGAILAVGGYFFFMRKKAV